MLTVANLKTTRRGIRCDRSSVLGNPFAMRNEGERSAVIQAYRRYLWEVLHLWEDPEHAAKQIAQKSNLILAAKWKRPKQEEVALEIQRIEKLETATLLCWCAPLACHCDVIVNYVKWWNEQKECDRT